MKYYIVVIKNVTAFLQKDSYIIKWEHLKCIMYNGLQFMERTT